MTNEEIVRLAQKKWSEDGRIEIDNDAKISLSYDPGTEPAKIKGAYVQAWVWVDLI